MKAIKIALCLVFSLGVAQLSAQHYLGVRGGWGAGNARFLPAREGSGYQGGLYAAGISYRYYGEPKFIGGVEIDLQYIGKGYKYDMGLNSDTSFHRTINAVELPIMWQPHAMVFHNKARVFVNLGVHFSYNLNSHYFLKSRTDGVIEQGRYPMQLTRDNRLGYGLCGGVGLGANLTQRIDLSGEVRYSFGYSDILRNRNKYEGNPLQSPLDNFNVFVSLSYRLGRSDSHKTKPAPETAP